MLPLLLMQLSSGEAQAPQAVTSTGGWFDDWYARRRYQRTEPEEEQPEEIPEPVKEIIEDVAERSVKKRITLGNRETVRDLEIALRIRLRTRDLLFRQIYLDALQRWRNELQRRADAMLAEEIELATVLARLL